MRKYNHHLQESSLFTSVYSIILLDDDYTLLYIKAIAIIKYQIYLVESAMMSRQYATIVTNNAIQAILNKSAQKLYDKYLLQKLPYHANQLQQHTFNINFKISSIKIPNTNNIEKVHTKPIQNIPNDAFAPKRINIKKYTDQYSTFSPKKSNLGKSTKYQTIIQSQNSLTQKMQISQQGDYKYLPQQSFLQSSPQFKKADRPMTMNINRSHKNNLQQSIIKEIPQKRAATCHVRKRKPVSLLNQQKKRLIKIEDKMPVYIIQQMNETHKIRIAKYEKIKEENYQQRLQNQAKTNTERLERQKIQNYQQIKKQIQGKSKETLQIRNFQSQSGNFFINGKIKPQSKPHIIQLQFNPQEQNITSQIESKHSKVNGVKKTTFLSNKLQKKIKMTQQQFTNNNERQTSSIPFLALSEGVAIQQSSLEVKASRQRPEELTRKKYNSIQAKHRFKSHNNYLNSVRINLYETIQTNQVQNEVMVQSVLRNPSQKLLHTTFQTKTTMNNSILWRSNYHNNSQNKIKISNKQLLQSELI